MVDHVVNVDRRPAVGHFIVLCHDPLNYLIERMAYEERQETKGDHYPYVVIGVSDLLDLSPESNMNTSYFFHNLLSQLLRLFLSHPRQTDECAGGNIIIQYA